MEVKILGSISPYPKDNRNCSGYLIKNGESKILLDCGSGSSRLLNFPDDLNKLMIVISHLHPDHFSDIFGIINACDIYNKLGIINEPIKIVLPYKKRRKSDNDYFSYMLLKSYENKNIQFIEVEKETLYHEEFSILFKHTVHCVTNNAIRIENNGNSVGYTGDTGNKSIDELSVFFKDVNLLICETTFLKSDNAVSNDHLHAF